MNKRPVIIGLAWVLCLGTVWGMLTQRQHLRLLRAQQARNAAPVSQAASAPDLLSPAGKEAVNPDPATEAEWGELLRLRAEVTRLNARKRELAGVPAEAERLRTELAISRTNSSGANRLPPGYIRRAQAQLLGYSTPEAALESFLWALEHQDPARLMQALSPSQAQNFQSRIGASAERAQSFFKDAKQLPGLAIQSRENLPDGSVQLQVIPAPGLPPERLQFELINGEWKLNSGPF